MTRQVLTKCPGGGRLSSSSSLCTSSLIFKSPKGHSFPKKAFFPAVPIEMGEAYSGLNHPSNLISLLDKSCAPTVFPLEGPLPKDRLSLSCAPLHPQSPASIRTPHNPQTSAEVTESQQFQWRAEQNLNRREKENKNRDQSFYKF